MIELLENLDVLQSEPEPQKVDNVSAQFKHRNPFEFMEIDNNHFLNDIDGRSACSKCSKSRKFFCYSCFVPIEELKGQLPKVRLPVQIDIIKHKKEIDGKSTAIHAAILAPDNVNIYTYPNIPDYSIDEEGTVSAIHLIKMYEFPYGI